MKYSDLLPGTIFKCPFDPDFGIGIKVKGDERQALKLNSGELVKIHWRKDVEPLELKGEGFLLAKLERAIIQHGRTVKENSLVVVKRIRENKFFIFSIVPVEVFITTGENITIIGGEGQMMNAQVYIILQEVKKSLIRAGNLLDAIGFIMEPEDTTGSWIHKIDEETRRKYLLDLSRLTGQAE